MSDEAAFLDALKANPADDTARLVYADWLDERGEPAKAEYLRLTAELATGDRVNPASPALPRLIDLTVSLPPDWVAAVGSRFALILDGYPPTRKIATIKELRVVFGLGLACAKIVSESLPACLVAAAPVHALVRFDRMLSAAAGVRVRYAVVGREELRRAYTFRVHATQDQRDRDAERLVRALVEQLGIDPSAVRERAGGSTAVLADAADALTAGRYQTRLRALPAPVAGVAPGEPLPGYYDAHINPVRPPPPPT